jgi:hypothetical protein
MTENHFNTLLSGSVQAYSDDIQLLMEEISFEGLDYKNIDKSLSNIAETHDDILTKSLCYRILALDRFQSLLNHDRIYTLKEIWDPIYKSLIILNTDQLISSIGSQGFLAIPLFRLDKGTESFELLRIHFWSSDFDQLINKKTRDSFSIHSHQFHAKSWILCGEVYNTRMEVKQSDPETDYCIFKIQWNDPNNDLNRKGSIAINTYKYCEVEEGFKENYLFGEAYELEAGKFHKSRTNENNDLNATLFYFSTANSRVSNSFVLGPSIVKESEINRKIDIDPIQYLQ